MKDLKISGLNFDIVWKDKKENFRRIEELLGNTPTDLFVLPEMFTTGFYMNPEEIADRQNETLDWMKSFAKKTDTAICGSASVYENNHFFNRFYFVLPDGSYDQYDKRHLFSFTGEDKKYSAGTERVIVNYKGWRILLQVCYDLRFPAFSRNLEEYDLLIYVASWPKIRTHAWDALLKARAIENMSYVIGVNRIGADANGHEYIGHSQAVDFLGDYVLEPEESESSFLVVLNKETMLETRRKLGFLNDRDSFEIK